MKRRSQPPAKRVPFPNRVHWAQPKSLDQVSLPAELTNEAIPPDNPQTPEKIALGQKLFFDGRLSADGTVACSTCHDPARAFYRWQAHIDRDQRPRRRTQRTDHSERALHKTQFWDGRLNTLEERAALPIAARVRVTQAVTIFGTVTLAFIGSQHVHVAGLLRPCSC